MNATSSSLGQGSYSTLPPSLAERLSRALYWPAAIALMLVNDMALPFEEAYARSLRLWNDRARNLVNA